MQRIIKRFLLHKQRETDEVGETDFDEIKQDLQMVRYEMMNDLKRSREETMRLVHHISNGLIIIGDELFSLKDSVSENMRRFKEYRATEFDFGDGFPEVVKSEPVEPSKDSKIITTATSTVDGSGLLGVYNKHTISNLESLGSSTDTQSGNSEANTDIVPLSSSPNSEVSDSVSPANSIALPNSASTIIDLSENAKLNLAFSSANELHVINEEDECSHATSIDMTIDNEMDAHVSEVILIEHAEQGVQTLTDDEDDDEEDKEKAKKYLF